MATFVEGRSVARDAEPVGLMTEGAAGIAAIVLAILALAGVSSIALAAIATIVIGVGLMAQGFNTAAENARIMSAGSLQSTEWGGEVMVDCLAGGVGIVLGILALIGVNPMYLMSAALIVFGAALLLSGALALQNRPMSISAAGGTQLVSFSGSPAATGGMEILIGLGAAVLGILSLVLTVGGVLLLVGLLAVGAGLLVVSATFGSAILRIFGSTAA